MSLSDNILDACGSSVQNARMQDFACMLNSAAPKLALADSTDRFDEGRGQQGFMRGYESFSCDMHDQGAWQQGDEEGDGEERCVGMRAYDVERFVMVSSPSGPHKEYTRTHAHTKTQPLGSAYTKFGKVRGDIMVWSLA